MTILYTSLAEIKSFNPCASSWRTLLKAHNKTEADYVLFPLKECLKSNSFADVCWLLGQRKVEIQIAVQAARLCASSVEHIENSIDAAASYDAAAYATSCAATCTSYITAAMDAAINDMDAAAYDSYAAMDAATAATAAMDAASYAINAASYTEQSDLNKQFLLQAIEEYENEH